MDYTQLFYDNYSTIIDENDSPNIDITRATLDYLLDNSIGEHDIIRVMEQHAGKKVITKQSLPEWLWDNSLTRQGVYYYNRELQIIPEGRTLPYLEMRIRFTIDDLLAYFQQQFAVDPLLVDRKQYIGQLKSLIKRFSSLIIMEPVDFIISLIKRAKSCNMRIFEPFDLTTNGNAGATLEIVKHHIADAKAHHATKEIDRCYLTTS